MRWGRCAHAQHYLMAVRFLLKYEPPGMFQPSPWQTLRDMGTVRSPQSLATGFVLVPIAASLFSPLTLALYHGNHSAGNP